MIGEDNNKGQIARNRSVRETKMVKRSILEAVKNNIFSIPHENYMAQEEPRECGEDFLRSIRYHRDSLF